MTRYAMVADLGRCVGCQTCTAACRQTSATPPGVQWRKVLDLEFGEYPDVQRVFVPTGCQHCYDPPCMHVCPSTATRQRDDGIVTIDYDLCIGCGYCAVACPYQARFKIDKPVFAHGDRPTELENLQFDERRIGVAQKCTFCSDRIDDGVSRGLTPGLDPDATPVCVNSCIAEALHFGDIEDPDSNVSRLLANNDRFQMHGELATDPGFHYLWNNHRNEPNIRFGSVIQKNWDWRAAGNLMFGGTGGSLMFVTALATFADSPSAVLSLLSLLVVGTGLGLVWLEIGRPWRFVNVFSNPRTSWMTREAGSAVVLFALALAGAGSGQPAVGTLAGLAGLAFLYCQARMLKAAKGVPAWRASAIVPLIVSTGLSEGTALLLLMVPLAGLTTNWPSYLLLALIVVRTVAWQRYRAELAVADAPAATLATLARIHASMVFVGGALPALLVVLALMMPDAASVSISLSAALVLLTGWHMKYSILTGAAHLQGFALGGPRGAASPPSNVYVR